MYPHGAADAHGHAVGAAHVVGVVAAGGVGSVGAVVQAPVLAVVDIRLSGGLVGP